MGCFPLFGQVVSDTTYTSLSPIRRGFAPSFINYKKVHSTRNHKWYKFTSCLSRIGGSLRVLRLPPPLKLVAIIFLKMRLKRLKSNQILYTFPVSILLKYGFKTLMLSISRIQSYLPFSRVVFHKRRYLAFNIYYIGQISLFIFSLKIKQPYDPIVTLICVIKIWSELNFIWDYKMDEGHSYEGKNNCSHKSYKIPAVKRR